MSERLCKIPRPGYPNSSGLFLNSYLVIQLLPGSQSMLARFGRYDRLNLLIKVLSG
jgi:hypothetical protein